MPKVYDPKFEPFYMRKITLLEYLELVLGTTFLLLPRLINVFFTHLLGQVYHVIPSILLFDRSEPYPEFFLKWMKITVRYLSKSMIFSIKKIKET